MNQEIEGKLEAIFDSIISEECPDYKKAIKAIQELVVSTIPEALNKIPPHCETDLILAEGYNDCRTEILKKWS